MDPARDGAPLPDAEELMGVVRLLPDVLFRCHKGEDGRIYWSLNEGGLAEEFHLTTAEIQGVPLEELFPGGASKEIRDHFEAAFLGETTPFVNEIAGRYFRHHPQPVHGPDGSVVEVVGFITEVTELVEAQRRLAEANQELEHFSSRVSHDLRSPLSALRNLLYSFRLRYQDVLPEEAMGSLERMDRVTQRMDGTIGALLDLARAQGKPLERCRVDLAELVHDVRADLEARDPQRHVVWEIPRSLMVSGDPDLLRILMQNLLDNAWRHTSGRDPAHVRVYRDGAWIVVEDNGEGFDPAVAERLFEAFHQGKGTGAGAAGLGLSTVRRVVARHGGVVEAEGRPGHGARFRFTLDAADGSG